MEQLRPPKDIQGRSWNENKKKKKKKGRGELHYPFQWLNSEQNWNVYVVSFVSLLHFTSPSVDTFVRYDWQSENILPKEPATFYLWRAEGLNWVKHL